jgi:hypothetical protein
VSRLRAPVNNPRGLPTRAKPIGVVITPTKGLANNIVCSFAAFFIHLFTARYKVDELSKLNVSGFSYCSETLTEARKTGLCLAREIKECVRWQVVCVDPEHLRDKEWREITEGPIFRSNVLFACVDEAHLINSWGLSFRSAFSLIGTFLRGRFPSSISNSVLIYRIIILQYNSQVLINSHIIIPHLHFKIYIIISTL